MRTTTLNKEILRNAFIKMQENKILVRDYLKGNIPVEVLASKGIELVRVV